MTTINSNTAALGVLDDSFWAFDIAGERAKASDNPTATVPLPDGIVSVADLEAVASDTTGAYTPEQKQAAQWLLDRPDLLLMVDTASQDSPMGDGRISHQDVTASLGSPLLEQSGNTSGVFNRPHEQSLQTLYSDFDVFDGAGDNGKTDGKVSFNDLTIIAYGEEGDYTPEQRATAHYLMAHMELFQQLDADGNGMVLVVDVERVASRPAPPDTGTPVAGDSGVMDDKEIQAVAELYAPVLILSPDDGFLLTDPDKYIQGSVARDGDGNIVPDPVTWLAEHPGETLVIDPGFYVITSADQFAGNGLVLTLGQPSEVVADPAAYLAQPGNAGGLLVIPGGQVIGDPSQVPAEPGGSYTTMAEGWVVDDPVAYLEENPDAQLIYEPGLGNRVPDASKTYYVYDAEENTITYWYFYPNNDGPTSGMGWGDAQNHEGDWERVTIQLDDQNKPATVYYSAHSGSSGVPYEQVVRHEGRPVVFVAAGSHANYFLPGDAYATEFPGAHDKTVASPADGLIYDTAAETELVRIDPDNGPPWWYDVDVRWGERRAFEAISGPSGPNPEKGSLAPSP